MEPLTVPPSHHPGFCIGSDGQSATVQPDAAGAVVAFETRGRGRQRAWLTPTGLGCQAVLPVPSGAARHWAVTRISRDQAELETSTRDAHGVPALLARQIVTVDDWGLHLALSIENLRPTPVNGNWGFLVSLAAPAGSVLEVPPGSLGAGLETVAPVSPFGWPRRSVLRCADGDAIEVLGHAPLARTEVRRRAEQIDVRVLSPGVIASGQTVRAECRLRSRLHGD
jgi:hypothetical protein